MREIDAILDAWRQVGADRTDAVLATVVHVTGSAYRRPGARMLMIPGGRRVGCVSGGCLEGEILKKAWWFTESGAPVVRVYDTTSEDDAVWEFGLGCNGVVHVMLERIGGAEASETLRFLDRERAARKPCVVATVIRSGARSGAGVGSRLLLEDAGIAGGSLAGSSLEGRVLAHAAAALREKRSRLAHIEEADVFVEWVGPPLALVIFGAGHDAIPLVGFAARLGWDVTVADGRPSYAMPARFPGARRVVRMESGNPLGDIAIDRETAVVMMTHNYPLDSVLLPRVLALGPRYLGMLGPRARADRLFAEMGIGAPACVHAPAGLDAGSESPEAIALSIAAEIQAERNCRPGGMLKDRQEPIHAPAYEVGQSAATAPGLRPSYCETVAGYE
jgi:xanthine/CO dehydrogenase XdhC/CoxF family maturation factor